MDVQVGDEAHDGLYQKALPTEKENERPWPGDLLPRDLLPS